MPSTSSRDRTRFTPRRLFTLSLLLAGVGGWIVPQFLEAGRQQPWSLPSLSLLPSVFAGSTPSDYWHTSGNQILNSHDRPVRISGLNWSGFETTNGIVGGLDVQDYRVILRGIAAQGYNTVRIPFSNEMVETPAVPDHIAFTSPHGEINGDLRGLDSLEILDRIVAAAGKAGLKVILDNHRSEAGSSAEANGLWYTARYPESAWIADWTSLARRYRGDATVIGMDLRNEPHNASSGGACWNCGGAKDWHHAAERAGDAILQANPRLLIFVEGVDAYQGSTTWWGGNLAGVRDSPIRLALPGHLVYSAHVYGPTEYAQPWFNEHTSSESLRELWRSQWAFVSERGIAPVWVGEFGTTNDDRDVQSEVPGSEGQWFSSLIEFLGAHPRIGWTYWGANAEDRYALLDSSYDGQPANAGKALALESIVGLSLGSGVAVAASHVGSMQRLSDYKEHAALSQDSVETMAGAAAPESRLPATIADEVSRDSGEQVRVEVARAWRIPAPTATSATSVHPTRTMVARLNRTQASEDNVNDAVAEQVRQANAEALRHAQATEP